MGGSGTTFLMEALAELPDLSINPPNAYVNPLKHPLFPPRFEPAPKRAVFLFACPYNAVLSLFRRGFDALHYAHINELVPDDLSFPEDAWRETCARFQLHEATPDVWVDDRGHYARDIGALDWYAQRQSVTTTARAAASARIAAIAGEAYRDLDDYLARGIDALRKEEQFDRWTSPGAAPYPILLVRYETLYDNLETLTKFLGLAPGRLSIPPRQARTTDYTTLPEHDRLRLVAMYKNLADKIASVPDVFLNTPLSS